MCFVSVYTKMHSVSSFIDDAFTKTVFIIRKDKEYLFTGSTASVCRKDNWNEAGPRAKLSVFVFVCL